MTTVDHKMLTLCYNCTGHFNFIYRKTKLAGNQAERGICVCFLERIMHTKSRTSGDI